MNLYDIEPARARVFFDIDEERDLQTQLRAQGRFRYTLDDDGLTDFERFTILTEEIGEIAEVIQAMAKLSSHKTDEAYDSLYGELCQLAALAVAWMERL